MTNFKIDKNELEKSIKNNNLIGFLQVKIREGIEQNAFQNKSIHFDTKSFANVVLVTLNEKIRDKYGDESFMKRLKFNPYLLIKEAVDYTKKHNFTDVATKMEVDYVDPATHNKVKNSDGTFKKILPSMRYLKNKAFYNEDIVGSKNVETFQKLAGIGIRKGNSKPKALDFESFEQNCGEVIKKISSNKYRKGYVTTYTTKGGETSEIYIIEWESGDNVEVLSKEEFYSRYPNFKKGKIDYKTGREYESQI